jgi:hypothetical protein
MEDSAEAETLTAVMADLTQRGYTEHFVPTNGRLRGVQSGRSFLPEELTIAEYHRFEGVSDPDDMAIFYAIQTRSGVRGTLADAFGVYSDPRVSALVQATADRSQRVTSPSPQEWRTLRDRS